MPSLPHHPDAELDRLLCDVSVPRGLHARLAAAATGDEQPDLLADQLRDVPVPTGLHRRIVAAACADAADDAAVEIDAEPMQGRPNSTDEKLRDVPIPLGLHYRLREAAAWPHVNRRRMLAVAALILLAFTSYEAFVIGLVRDLFRRGEEVARDQVRSSATAVERLRPRSFAVRIPTPAPPPVALRPAPRHRQLRDVLAREHESLAGGPRPLLSSRPRRPDIFQATALALGTAAAITDAQGFRPQNALPDAERAWFSKPQGVDARLGAAERKFLLDFGVFPRVSPRDFPTSVVPLGAGTGSFEQARADIAAGNWPAIEQVRAEEFLAAVELAYGKPTDTAARLIAAGAVAPWNTTPPGASSPDAVNRLLQLSVQARELPAAPRRPTHLTIGLDVTSSMRNGGRIEMARHALRSLVGRLGGADRVTLVALAGGNPVVIEDAGRGEAEQLLAAIDWFSADGGGSLPQGALVTLQTALRRELPKSVARRVVLVSDAFDEAEPRDLRVIEQLAAGGAARGLQINLIDVSAGDEPTAWNRLVERSGGRVFAADNAAEMRAALWHALSGREQTVAAGVELSVAFNPQSVASYRLFGHEPTVLTGLTPPVEFNLTAGQTTTVLYELQLTDGKDPLVATADLRWRDPADGTPHEARVEITRGMLNPAFDKSAPALQLATIAAAAAGRLKNSPWGDNVAPGEVLQWALRLERTGTVRGVESWRDLWQQIERLPARRGTPRGTR